MAIPPKVSRWSGSILLELVRLFVVVVATRSMGVVDAAAFRPAFVLARPTSTTRLSVRVRGAGKHSSRRIALRSGSSEPNGDNDTRDEDRDEQQLQQELNAMMSGGDTVGGVFGLGCGGKSLPVGNKDKDGHDDDEEVAVYNAAPLFTGSVVLIVNLAITLYGFYVFFTGDDPVLGLPNVHDVP
jgi:hypothetical protein